MIKSIGIGLATLIAGVPVGAGGAWVVLHLAPQYVTGHPAKPRPKGTEFVPPVEILAPLVLPDGRLTGYARFEIQLEVAKGDTDAVGAKLPLLMNAVNLRTYRAPLASGPDGLVPGLDQFRRVVMDAALEVYGKGVVHSVAVTQASPA